MTKIIDPVCLGLDLSVTSTGYSFVSVGRSESGLIKTKPKDFPNSLVRASFIVGNIMGLFGGIKPDFVCIEDYFLPVPGFKSISPKTVAHLIELGTLVRFALLESSIPFTVVTTGQMKKFVTGNGRSDKAATMLGLYKRWGIDVENNDISDATGLALLGRSLFSVMINNPSQACYRGVELIKPQLETLRDVFKKRTFFNWNDPLPKVSVAKGI